MRTQFFKISILVVLTITSCKTQSLNLNSESLHGKYVGIGHSSARIELWLEENNEFKFWNRKGGHYADFSDGKWVYTDNTLVLNSNTLNKPDSLHFMISAANWIEFKGMAWEIQDKKRIRLKNGKWKLERKTE